MSNHYKVVIVGAGTAGISVAARLVRESQALKDEIAIIDPAQKHYYQPLWTLVGAGVAKKEQTERDTESLIPEGVDWIQEAVTEFDPENNAVKTAAGNEIHYDYLVVAAGIQVNWDAVKGLKEAIGHDGVVSNYSYDYTDKTWEALRNFKGGNAIFTQPSTPIKCGGAPQKIMYLAEDHLSRSGVRGKSEVHFYSAAGNIFAVDKYAKTLNEVIKRKKIQTHYQRDLIEIRPDKKEAVFKIMGTNDTETVNYEMIHVTPPMGPLDFIKQSPISDQAGWVDVDAKTLQHKKFSNIFAIGDASNLPTSKTGAAIRKQAPVLVENMLSEMKGNPLTAHYDGYTSCPLVTGYGRLVLAEFDYDKNPQESFPFDQSKERYSMYVLKKDFLPVIYWDGMLKGLM